MRQYLHRTSFVCLALLGMLPCQAFSQNIASSSEAVSRPEQTSDETSTFTSIQPLVSFAGADTRIAKYENVRIVNQDAWVQFWLRHTGQAGTPEDYNQYRRSGAPHIDFSQCMVIAITESPGQINAGIKAVAIHESADEIIFDYDNMHYQARSGTSAPGNAYGYFVLPFSNKPIVMRHNVQTGQSRYAGEPPVWKEVKRMKSPKAEAALSAREDAAAPPTRTPADISQPAGLNIVFAHDPGPGHYDGVVGRPDDRWNLVELGTTKLETVITSDGRESPVELQLSANDGEWGVQQHSGIFHGYIYHNCQCVDLQATLKGLPRGRYKAYVYAHGDAPNQNAMVELAVGPESFGKKPTLNDGSTDFRSPKLAEGVQYVSMEFMVTGDQPVVITSHRSGSSYSMLNAIQIVPVR